MMFDAKSTYAEIAQECLNKDRMPLIFGEARGYDEQLMKDVVFSSIWDSSKCKEPLGIFEHLINKIVTDNKCS
jgi:hypothetical protein